MQPKSRNIDSLKQLREIEFKLTKKVAEKHLDDFVDDFYKAFLRKKNEARYIFDFSDVEWISNEELLTLTALFKSLIDSEIEFKVNFLKNGSSQAINERKARQFVQLWDVWKIFRIVPNADYDLFFDLDGNTIDRFKKKYNITSVAKEIYESYGVTPFVALEKIDSYNDQRIIEKLHDTYRLEAATSEILEDNNCYLPFHNQTLSSIISKELYENFLDHFTKSVFGSEENFAFLSLILKKKLNSENLDSTSIQRILQRNFKDESIPELIDFYVEKGEPEVYRNRSILQLSFVDFGEGIPKTLKTSYLKNSGKGYSELHTSQQEDTRILEYAFKHNSSQHELKDKYQQEFAVPRGLFDLLSIVKRFEGAIIARSNYGKVAFDFSNGNSIENAVRYFGDQSKFFPGTLFTIFIPERETTLEIDSTSIKPYESIGEYSFKKENVKHISLFEIQTIQKNTKLDKKDFYNELFTSFLDKIEKNEDSLIYLDFKGWDIDERVTRKIIFFLCTDYRINLKNNVIAINPPSKTFLSTVKDELLALNDIDRKFKIHPTPFVAFNNNDLEIFWLGIFSDKDIDKLNDLLFEEHDLRKSDFENPEEIVGHVNSYDKYGNLSSIIDSESILYFYKEKALEIEEQAIYKIIDPCLKSEKNSIYLCNGNYYQYEYLQLFDALSNKNNREYLSSILLRKIQQSVTDLSEYVFVGITSSSHRLVDFFEDKLGGDAGNYIRLNNYFSFEEEQGFKLGITKESKVILLCDVISTGFMVERFASRLNVVGTSLEAIGVLVNSIDVNFEPFKHNYSEYAGKIISVINKPLKKFSRKDISNKIRNRELKVTRINPFTNTPIIQEIKQSNFGESVLLNNQEFVELLSLDHILVGYFNFNSLVHPYFFDMHSILNDEKKSKDLVVAVFDKLGKQTSLSEIDIVYYPKSSGIQNIDFKFLQERYFKSHGTKIFELERFSTNEGWRFPHPPQSLIELSLGKNVLILDDGSCSGESISQMIDEVAFLEVNSIVVLSLVGRINDHKREFFSRIKKIDSGGNDIPVKIFFGSNWHIPTYHLSKSPVIEENKWLDQLISLPNIPQAIKAIARVIKRENTPRKITDGTSSYLLKTKEGLPIYDELVLVRDEFGKISEYRFYKEYFNFFDDFIAYHESKNSRERGDFPYKKIETVCAVFLHEPYLYDKVKVVIPDVIDRIEDFVKLFVVENKIPENLLCYNWNRKDMIHLLFIVFKNESLLQLFNKESLKQLMVFASESESTLNYILYKLVKYFPLEKSDAKHKRFDNELKELLENVDTGDVDLNKQIKKFYNFLKTLPSGDDIESHLRTLKENYNKEKEPDLHDDKISFNHNVSLILGKVREAVDVIESGETIPETLSESIVTSWFHALKFITPILTFSISFEEYLAPFPYFKLINSTERNSDSLRSLVGENDDLIFAINNSFTDIEKLKQIERNTKLIQSNFTLNTEFHKLIENRKTDWNEFLQVFEGKLKDLDLKVVIDKNIQTNHSSILVPKSYACRLILDELVNNLKNHCKKGEEIEVKVLIKEIDRNNLQIDISNPIAASSQAKSNGEGTKCLNLLSKSEHFGFDYSAIGKEFYHQTLKFKTL